MKKYTRTRAKLPEDERTIGGDAPSGFENKKRQKEMKKIYEKVKSKEKKKK